MAIEFTPFLWLLVGLCAGAVTTFFVVNGRRHRDLIEFKEQLEALKAAKELEHKKEIEAVKRRIGKVADADANLKVEALAKDLLPVIDAMHMATNLKTDNVGSVKDGVYMICERLETVLSRHGCEMIAPNSGDDFDPNHHEAVACRGEAIHVIDVKRVGFKVGDRVVRPAAVEVGVYEVSEEERHPLYNKEEERELAPVHSR